MARECRPRRLRTITEFAEQEITIPTGPYADKAYRVRRQPWIAHLFGAIDMAVRHHTYTEIAATGPSQSGKSLNCLVIPVLYHLFEIGETVIIGVPEMDMAKDKWEMDFLPVIERTRYRDLLPRVGRGSKGGTVGLLRCGNGAAVKFMSGGGGDKTRAYFTSRVIAFTEVNAMAISTVSSQEANKIKQIEARTRSYGERRLVYKECTETIETGHIHERIAHGTASEVYLRCPMCGEHVLPRRENLVGWREAVTEDEARENTRLECPACTSQWTDDDRRRGLQDTRCLSRGQSVVSGVVVGDAAKTSTYGFRWSAVHNQFMTLGALGVAEWQSRRELDQTSAEKELCQFIWGLPFDNPNVQTEKLDYDRTRRKRMVWTRGVVPEDTTHVTCGVDSHQRLLYWTCIAWRACGMGHVFDYGTQKVTSGDAIPIELGLYEALCVLRDKFEGGWARHGTAEVVQADQIWIDAGWKSDGVYRFIKDESTDKRWYKALIGRGAGQQYQRVYQRPTKTGAMCHKIGDNWHVMWDQARGLHRVEANVDNWKSRLHAMLRMDGESAGTMTLFGSNRDVEHDTFVRHLLAEEEVRQWDEKKGWLTQWAHLNGANHYLDSTTYATAAASFVGVKFLRDPDPPVAPDEEPAANIYQQWSER